jgi:hypothetical protein
MHFSERLPALVTLVLTGHLVSSGNLYGARSHRHLQVCAPAHCRPDTTMTLLVASYALQYSKHSSAMAYMAHVS